MTKVEIQNSIRNLRMIQNPEKSLYELKINWETDIEQMNFSELRSTPECDIKNSRVDKFDPRNEFGDLKEAAKHFFSDQATYNLIEFIKNGNKIIPPLYIQSLEYDGETFSMKKIAPIWKADGYHRVFVSAWIGLKEIPVIVTEKIEKYSFHIDKWDFECTDERIIAKSKNSEHRIEIDNTRAHIDDGMSPDSIVDNTLVIRTH